MAGSRCKELSTAYSASSPRAGSDKSKLVTGTCSFGLGKTTVTDPQRADHATRIVGFVELFTLVIKIEDEIHLKSRRRGGMKKRKCPATRETKPTNNTPTSYTKRRRQNNAQLTTTASRETKAVKNNSPPPRTHRRSARVRNLEVLTLLLC